MRIKLRGTVTKKSKKNIDTVEMGCYSFFKVIKSNILGNTKTNLRGVVYIYYHYMVVTAITIR